MFGTPFALGLDVKEVDTIWIEKIHKKLKILKHNPITNSMLGHNCQFPFDINIVVLHQCMGGHTKSDEEMKILTSKLLMAWK